MKKLLSGLTIIALLISGVAMADNLVNIPNPSAVWDSTTATLYSLGIPGQGQSGQTLIPSAGTTNTWTAPQTFSGKTSVTGGLVLPSGGMGIGTTLAGSPLTIIGLGTSAPIGTSATGYLCIDSANNVYRKATCP